MKDSLGLKWLLKNDINKVIILCKNQIFSISS
jgi:hypothetical protein